MTTKARHTPNPRNPRMIWTEAQIARLIELYPDHTNWQIAQAMGLREDQVNAKADHIRKTGIPLAKSAEHLRTRAGRITPEGAARHAATRFKPGHATWNKGKRYAAGGRSVLTRFKRGNRPHTWVPIGTQRVYGGILQVKVSDTGYTPADWQSHHKRVWEAANGPLPKGHVVCFRDGNRSNFDLANLECVSRAELMQRNSIHTRVPEAVRPLVRSLGQIRRRLRERLQQIEGRAGTPAALEAAPESTPHIHTGTPS